MDWLQKLDATLFRFFNDTLKNPVFDVVMPWLSGNVLFVPLIVVAAIWLIGKQRHKGVLCFAMLALVIPLGDSYVCRTLKTSIQRPRPYVTLPEVHQPPGVPPTSRYASMPSSHAANWFCATMIAWIYFRRSARFFIPIAAAVSFSRIYNGVHYPADILAGAILGAGYGAATVLVLEGLWRWAGKKYFPHWHAQLPTLVPTGPHPAPRPPQPTPNSHWLRAGFVLIALVTLARWIYLASDIIELSQDEAYQWQWSKHLALSYFSKPPLIAYTQFISTSLWGDNAFGVRFCSPLIAATLGIMVLKFFAREVGARVGFYLLLCVLATPLLSIGATLMTVDPLCVLFWTAAMFAGWRAIRPEAGAGAWAWVGLWMGLGFLSKWVQLLQLACWAVFFVLWRPARAHLRRPGPWLALALNLLAFTPVIIWNQQNNWITAEHVADNAALDSSWPPPLDQMAEWFFTFLGQELGLLNPVFFVSLVWAACAFWKRYRDDLRQVYLFSMGAPVFLVYLAWTLHSRVLPNWIAPSILPLFCLMAVYWERERLRGARQVIPSLACGLVFGFCAVLLLHDTNLIRKIAGRNLPDHIDPIARVSGWRASAQAVGEARQQLLREGKPVFIIGSHYGITSLISFYLPEAKAGVPHDPLVYYRTSKHPVNQYYFWPGYLGRKGQNAIYVVEVTGTNRPPPASVVAEFESLTPLPLQPIIYRGRTLHRLQMYECRNLR